MARARVAVPPLGRLDCGGGYRFSPFGWRGLDTETRAGTQRVLTSSDWFPRNRLCATQPLKVTSY